MRQCAQCLGRVMRRKNDYGLMILADSRFARPGKYEKLPEWIKKCLDLQNINITYEAVFHASSNFFRKMGANFELVTLLLCRTGSTTRQNSTTRTNFQSKPNHPKHRHPKHKFPSSPKYDGLPLNPKLPQANTFKSFTCYSNNKCNPSPSTATVWVCGWGGGRLIGVSRLSCVDHLRSPSSWAAWEREVPGSLVWRQNST